MPTQLDNWMKSKNMVLAFGGAVAAAAAWSIWGGDMFPAEERGSKKSSKDGEDEEEKGWTKWSDEDMRRWLAERGHPAPSTDGRGQLKQRILEYKIRSNTA